ncbi:MAG TPA: hypothetical protein VGF63_03760 [Solirubrobacteraceae bacterium]
MPADRARRWRARIAMASALCLIAGGVPAGATARTVTPLDLALRFQPHLLFDRGEPWRPIDVDAFLAEPGHRACSAASGTPVCAPLTSVAQLTPAVAYLDLRGTSAGGADATAPDLQTCARSKPALLDCDEGGRTRIYAHVTTERTRIAIDYWWFLRYNAFLLDQHEGDWEGVTVVVDATGRRVEEVHFAAHASIWRYDDGVARLDGGRHVRVYLARGSHAAYPRACARACTQTRTLSPEGRYDGASPWVANDPATCDRRCIDLLPEAQGAPASWNAWDGRWGVDLSSLFRPPLTPAFQRRYEHPFVATRSARHRFSGLW